MVPLPCWFLSFAESRTWISFFAVQWDRENAALYPPKSKRKTTAKKRTVKKKRNNIETHFVSIPGGESWSHVPTAVSIEPDMWVQGLHRELWQICRAGVQHETLKRNTIEFKYLPWQVSCLMQQFEHLNSLVL